MAELDELAEPLYAVAPGEFVAARDERAREARQAGNRELAAQLAKLRRPTVSAWLVNLLWRERRAAVDELLERAAEFRTAELTGQRLRELSARRRELLRRLVEDAQSLGVAAGVRLSAEAEREIEATFAAAIADEDAARQVRGGRLERPLSYAGFGPELQLVKEPQTAADRGLAAEQQERLAGGQTAADPAAVESRGRLAGPAANTEAGAGAGVVGGADRDAERRVGPAREAVAAAERTVDEHSGALDAAERRRTELTERRAELRKELDRVRAELAGVEAELTMTERAVRAESVNLQRAQRELERASGRLARELDRQ